MSRYNSEKIVDSYSPHMDLPPAFKITIGPYAAANGRRDTHCGVVSNGPTAGAGQLDQSGQADEVPDPTVRRKIHGNEPIRMNPDECLVALALLKDIRIRKVIVATRRVRILWENHWFIAELPRSIILAIRAWDRGEAIEQVKATIGDWVVWTDGNRGTNQGPRKNRKNRGSGSDGLDQPDLDLDLEGLDVLD